MLIDFSDTLSVLTAWKVLDTYLTPLNCASASLVLVHKRDRHLMQNISCDIMSTSTLH